MGGVWMLKFFPTFWKKFSVREAHRNFLGGFSLGKREGGGGGWMVKISSAPTPEKSYKHPLVKREVFVEIKNIKGKSIKIMYYYKSGKELLFFNNWVETALR